ncbi:EFR1 family ferrodoxin [Anaerotignum propionicum]|uniref:4Fe-4S dicluster domain-containing protein n=1 Tax=Anaerotignum propionicum DSM 1682 TaxID=991789 RepID=A0A0X1U965_ANAPI|nr:EFR1 family ferrodoxin [Anaerotignum propionicum]AMJ41487.1 ferredoxin-2 [Anaerotignum propionicum DSM 1682]SHE69674.1 4Fe-4S dicluster domain-containing protein [[Clostridium] propionicum DSM 1682] [Anaerotignum propionicum DSM 1682]
MENIIFCFSGTGNSLAVARDIANHIGNTKIVLIADLMNEEFIDLPYESIGIICPAYFSSLPPIIEQFVKKLNFSDAGYVYAVITAGALHGNSFNRLSSIIAERGGCLNAGYPMQMPGNYIAMYGAWPVWLQSYLLKKAKKKSLKISHSIKAKISNRAVVKRNKEPKSLIEKMDNYEKLALEYSVTDKCIGCETCVKLCPMNNIRMNANKPIFGETCARCMACIQWCPTKAIEYKNSTNRKHYTNPDIKAIDLFSKTKSEILSKET